MFYFVNRSTMRIAITTGAPPSRDYRPIDDAVVGVIADLLHEGRQVTPRQADLLVGGKTAEFLKTLDYGELERFGNGELRPRESSRPAPQLPTVTHFEYVVIPVSEAGGFGTAKGTAARMTEVLNEMGRDGWELATTSERDSRWMGGETILLTFRRAIVTEDAFAARVEAEERVRRRVLAQLDADG